MTEERRQVLQMLADGDITADEAGRLIDALEPRTTTAVAVREPGTRPKYLRVLMNSTDEAGPTRMDIRVPIKLLRAGVRLASLVPPQALAKANAQMEQSGMPFNLAELRPEQIDALIDALDELTVNLDETDHSMRVFCE